MVMASMVVVMTGAPGSDTKAIHLPAPARRNDCGGVELLDDRGSGDRDADVEAVALVERGGRQRAAERDLARALDGIGQRAWRGWHWLLARLELRHGDPQPQAIAHHLDRTLLGGMAVNPGMAHVEALARGGQRRRRDPFAEQPVERGA